MSATVHIAGAAVNVGGQLRQLCAWCGYRLIDVDLSCVATPMPEDGSEPEPYRTWEAHALVEIEESPGVTRSSVVQAHHGKLPANACAKKVKLHLVPSAEPR